MGRVLLAAAAAISLFALPGAAFGQNTGVTTNPVDQGAPAPTTPTSRFAPLLTEGRGANEEDIAELAMTLFGIRSENTELPNFSWGIPRSPALTLAGLSDTKVSTSDSLRSFVIQVPTTLNNEEQGQAIALDATLAQLLSETSATELYRYRGQTLAEAEAIAFHPGTAPLSRSAREALRQSRAATDVSDEPTDTYYQRWLRRSRIGIALYEGVEDSSDASKNVPARLAIGFSTSLWDESDPVMQRGPEGASFLEECQAQRVTQLYYNEERREFDLLGRFDGAQRQQVVARAFLSDLDAGARDLAERSGATERLVVSRDSYREAEDFAPLVHARGQALARNARMERVALRATQDCAQRASEIAELRRDLDIGIGVLYRGDPGQVSDFDERGAAAWVAFRYPWGVNLISPDFGSRLVRTDTRTEAARDARGNANSTDPLANVNSYWLVAGSARFSQDEFIATGNDATPEIQVDQSEAWIGIERYSQRFRFGAFYGYSEVEAAEPAGQPFERSGERYVISAQYRVGADENSGIWVGLTYGDTGNAANADNDDALMFSINFAPRPAYTIDWDNDDN